MIVMTFAKDYHETHSNVIESKIIKISCIHKTSFLSRTTFKIVYGDELEYCHISTS